MKLVVAQSVAVIGDNWVRETFPRTNFDFCAAFSIEFLTKRAANAKQFETELDLGRSTHSTRTNIKFRFKVLSEKRIKLHPKAIPKLEQRDVAT